MGRFPTSKSSQSLIPKKSGTIRARKVKVEASSQKAVELPQSSVADKENNKESQQNDNAFASSKVLDMEKKLESKLEAKLEKMIKARLEALELRENVPKKQEDKPSPSSELANKKDAATQTVLGEICDDCNSFVRDDMKKLRKEYKEAKLQAGAMINKLKCKMENGLDTLRGQMDDGLDSMRGQLDNGLDSLRGQMDDTMNAAVELLNNGKDRLEQLFPAED